MGEAVKGQISCLMCDFIAKSESDFMKHIKNHRFDVMRLPCFFCSAILTHKNSHKIHVDACRKLRDKVNDEQSTKPEDKIQYQCIWTCKICQKKVTLRNEPNLADFESVYTHLYTHLSKEKDAENKNVECPRCFATFNSYQVKSFSHIGLTEIISD